MTAQGPETEPLPVDPPPAAGPVAAAPAAAPAPAPAPAPGPARQGVSRRSILRGVGAVGAVGVVAAGVGAGAAVAVTRSTGADIAAPNKTKPKKMAAMPVTAMEGPLVVYVSDTTTGELDVFGASGQTRIKDAALVRRLLQSMK